MIQIKNKNKKQEEIKGENVGIDLTDRELVEPHLADSDFLASILDSIDAMAPIGTSPSTAPPPADGLLLLPSLFSFVLELGPESLCISTLEPCTRTRSVA